MSHIPPPRLVTTSHADLAVYDTGGEGVPLLLIHGNSSSHAVFRRQFQGRMAPRRFIAFDLPGHGASADAHDPVRTYSRSGLAACAAELLERLGVGEAAVLGWSLGGHVAIQMLSGFRGLRGLVLVGAPPVRPGRMADGFVASPANGLPGRARLSPLEMHAFASQMFGDEPEAFLLAAIARTDPRFRPQLFEAAARGDGNDQRLAVETARVPIAVVNGEGDDLIRLSYLERVRYGNLWSGRCHRLAGGHMPFWSAAEDFNALLDGFLGDLQDYPKRLAGAGG